MEITYEFVHYGKEFEPEKNTLVLDVGMKTAPGVIDHHHPTAEVECTASLIAKYPNLVLDHIKREDLCGEGDESLKLRIITHRLPDFDAVASIFLALKLIETGQLDPFMDKIAQYTKMVDSASLPKTLELSATPYSILRALFTRIRNGEEAVNQERVREGLKFMNFLYSKSKEGHDILQNRVLFSGIDRYESAMRKVENDYFNYLYDLTLAQKIVLFLPLTSGQGKKKVDGLIIKNPGNFLLKEWARRDRENSSLNEGFTLVMTIFGNKRYIIGVDREKGVNLRGFADLLNKKEEEKRMVSERPLGFQWYGGDCPFFDYRIVDSPQDGTSLRHEEIVDALLSFSENL